MRRTECLVRWTWDRANPVWTCPAGRAYSTLQHNSDAPQYASSSGAKEGITKPAAPSSSGSTAIEQSPVPSPVRTGCFTRNRVIPSPATAYPPSDPDSEQSPNKKAPLPQSQSLHSVWSQRRQRDRLGVARKPYRQLLLSKLISPARAVRPTEQDPYLLFYNARYGDVGQIHKSILRAARDQEYICGLHPSAWSSIVRAVSPRKWMLSPIHLPMNRDWHRHASGPMKQNEEYQRRRKLLSSISSQIFELRCQAGTPMLLADYRALLDHAAVLGDRYIAQALFEHMKHHGVKADRICYNALMRAALFFQTPARQHINRLRAQNDAQWKGVPAVLAEVKTIFQHMRHKAQIEPDVTSYCQLVTALARDGDLAGCRRVLSEYLQVDVAAVVAGQTIKYGVYERRSDLYPTRELLLTIANAFGSHDQISTSVRLLQFVSEKYDMTIHRDVWTALMHWVWFFCRKEDLILRSQEVRAPALQRITHLSTLLQRQYNVWPSMEVLDYIFKSSLSERMQVTDDFVKPVVRDCRQVLKERKGLWRMEAIGRSMSRSIPGRIIAPGDPTPFYSRLHKERIRIGLRVEFLRNWSKTILESGTPRSYRPSPDEAFRMSDWRLRGLPNFIRQWREFIRPRIKFQVDSGVVQLQIRATSICESSRPRLPSERILDSGADSNTACGGSRTHTDNEAMHETQISAGPRLSTVP